MTRAALFRSADLKRMAAIAKEHGVTVEMKSGDVTIRVIPTDAPTPDIPSSIRTWSREKAQSAMIWPPLNHREQSTMERLTELGVKVRLHWRMLKNFGPATLESLLERGFIGVSYTQNGKKALDEIWLTDAGDNAWKMQQDAYRYGPITL